MIFSRSRNSEESNPDRAPETVNVPVLVRETAKEGRAISGGRHEITETAEPFCLKGYKDGILSAIGNLVANAVRYTPPGGHISAMEAISRVAGACGEG